MKYENWPDERQAKRIENFLVDELTSIANHTPATTIKSYNFFVR